jgi:Flp pilus assembly protein TadD
MGVLSGNIWRALIEIFGNNHGMRSISPILAVFCASLLVISIGFGNPSFAQGKVKSSKTEYEILSEKAEALMAAHQPDEALRTIEAAINLDPKGTKLHATKAVWLTELKRTGEASREVATALKLHPSDPNAHAAYGFLLFTLKRFREAAKETQRAIELNPSRVDYHDFKTAYLLSGRDFPAALKEVSIGLSMAPKNAHLHNDKARVLWAMNRPKEALEEISTAVEINPTSEYLILKGQLLSALGRLTEAEEELSKAVKIDPNSDECRNLLLVNLCDQRKFASAESYLVNWLVNNKEHTNDQFICHGANLILTRGGIVEAREVIFRAAEVRGAEIGAQLSAAKIAADCSIGDDLAARKGILDRLEKSRDPVKEAQLISSSILSYKPYSISHDRALVEIIDVLESFNGSKRSIETNGRSIESIIRELNKSRDRVLTDACSNCSKEEEAFQLVADIGEIKRKRPLSESLYAALAKLQIQSSNLSQALACVSDGVKVYPQSLVLLNLRANLFAALGRKEQARVDLEQIQRQGRADLMPYALHADGRSVLSQFSSVMNDDEQAARQVLQPALKNQQQKLASASTPRGRAVALLELAELEIVEKNYGEALRESEESIKLVGGSARAYEVSSWALQGLKRYSEAREARRKALALFCKR